MTPSKERRGPWWFLPLFLLNIALGPAAGILAGLGLTRHEPGLSIAGLVMLGLLFLDVAVIFPVIHIKTAKRRAAARRAGR